MIHRNLIIPGWIEQSVTETFQFLTKMNHRFTETLLLQRGSHLWMPWPRSELSIQAPNEFGLDLKVPWAQLLVRKRFIRVTENEVWLNWTLDASRHTAKLFFKNHPSHKLGSRHWSVVSCVRCGCVGAGLGFPVGNSRFAPVFTPTLRSLIFLEFSLDFELMNQWQSQNWLKFLRF